MEMTTRIPKVIREGKISITQGLEITVCVLDDGRRVIPEEDMQRALDFLGLTEDSFNEYLKHNKVSDNGNN